MTESFQNYLFSSRNEVKVTLYVVTEKKKPMAVEETKV